MERILKNGEPDVKTDLAACYDIQAEKILRIVGGTVGRTYCIDNRYLLKIYDTDTAVGKLGLSGFPSGCRCWNGCRRAACGTESAVPSGRRKTAFSMFMTGLPERFFPSFPERRWGMAGLTPVRSCGSFPGS